MIGKTWKPALALGAVLALNGAAGADDRGTTMTLGGTGTAAQAATEDTELARGYHHGYGGGYGGYGGYRGGYGYGGGYGGYRGGYSSFYRGGYGGYYGGYSSFSYYRPAYYYHPTYYSSYYSYPVYSSYYGGCGSGFGFSLGIGGTAISVNTPAVALGTPFAHPMAQPAAPGDGTFRYDGGPAAPVPQPQADPQPIPPAGTSVTDLPVSLKPKAASPYKYKAYGEK